MEQFRQLGEALGGLKSVMVFRESIQINHRQCCLLLDVFTFAYECIADEIIQNLKFEEKNGKWKILEQPLREIHKIFREGEAYIRHCMEKETPSLNTFKRDPKYFVKLTVRSICQ